MDVVHLRNGHSPLCGTDLWPCAQCEREHDEVMQKSTRFLLRELGHDVHMLDDVLHDPHDYGLAGEYAHLYFTVIKPGRMGDLWEKPCWITDVAEIGDEVWVKAEKEAYDALKK